MNVSLPKQLEDWMDERVRSGMYQSASEVIREALRLLRRQDEDRKLLRVQELRRQLQVGLEQLDGGHSRNFDQNILNDLKLAGRRAQKAR